MKNGIRFTALAALLMLPLASCDCGDTDIRTSPAEIAVSPEQLSWGDVCAESTSTRSFTITNRGRSALHATLSIQGGSAEFFSLDREALSIDGAEGSTQVTVSFHPTGEDLRNTPHTSEVVIESNGSDEPIRIRLSGRVADVDPEPILSFGCSPELPLCSQAAGAPCCLASCDNPGSDDPADIAACNERKLASKILDFGAPVYDESTAVVSARILNRGCGALEVNEIRLETLGTDSCAPQPPLDGGEPVEQITVLTETPFTVEGSVDPLSPNHRDIEFEFVPTGSACDVNRKFVLVTNDPAATPDEPGTPGTGPASGTLSGHSTQPMLLISPNGNFGAVPYDQDKEIEFTVRNANVDQELTLQNLEIMGRDPSYFEIIGSRKCGEETGTNPTNIFMGRATGTADSCEDRFHVTVRYTPGQGGGVRGRHEARLAIHHTFGTAGHTLNGNSRPVLEAFPVRVTFGAPDPQNPEDPRVCSEDGETCLGGACELTCTSDHDCADGRCVDNICSEGGTLCAPACGTAERQLLLCNEGIAPLTFEALEIQDTDGGPAPRDNYFGEGGPLIFDLANDCQGETLLPDQCCTETVHFQDSRVGGETRAVLMVSSNDPDWEEGYAIDLVSNTTPSGRIPTAHIAPLDGNPPIRSWIRLDGTGSSVGLGELEEFRWRVQAPSTSLLRPFEFDVDPDDINAPCVQNSINGGNCLRLSEGGRVLEMWVGDTPGLRYEVSLRVTNNLCDPAEESGAYRLNVVTSDPDI